MQLPLRLRPVLGTDSSAIDAGMIEGLLGWREDADLDFKQELSRTREGFRGLVSDVAALANARGGVIVIGIRDYDTQAVQLTPLKQSGSREDRTEIHQAIAEYTAPIVTSDIQQIEAGEDGYYLILAVPKSQLAPHALRRPGEHSLHYPVRDGTRTRFLTEAEVADRYRDRFRLASRLIERVDEVRSEGEEVVNRSEDAGTWLSLALVPERPGRFDIDADVPEAVGEWMKALLDDVTPSGTQYDAHLQASVGYRRVVLGDWSDQQLGGTPLFTHCQLRTDGAGFFSQLVSEGMEIGQLHGYRVLHRALIIENEARIVSVVTSERLFESLVIGVTVLARHALERCGAEGDAIMAASLIRTGRTEATVLGSARIVDGVVFGLKHAPGTHELQVATPANHTVLLRPLYSPSSSMLVSVRLLMVDLLSLFGHAGVEQINNEGGVVSASFQWGLTPDRISSWAERWGMSAT